MSPLALPAARTFPRIKKQEHILLCHPQHENTTPEAPHDHTLRQTGNLVALTLSVIHTIHTRQHTQPPTLHPRTRSYIGIDSCRPDAADTPAVSLAHSSCRRDHVE
jgi:hypothetical protein